MLITITYKQADRCRTVVHLSPTTFLRSMYMDLKKMSMDNLRYTLLTIRNNAMQGSSLEKMVEKEIEERKAKELGRKVLRAI